MKGSKLIITLFAFFLLWGCAAKETELQRQKRCAETAEQYQKKVRDRFDPALYEVSWKSSYNEKLETCLCCVEVNRKDSGNRWSRFIFDAQNDKTLYRMAYGVRDGMLETFSSFQTDREFDEKVRDLFAAAGR